jgi:hypothetical protein
LGAEHVSWQPEALDVMLRGSLAHEVFERLFVPGKAHPSNEEIEAKVPDLLLDRIRALGAVSPDVGMGGRTQHA